MIIKKKEAAREKLHGITSLTLAHLKQLQMTMTVFHKSDIFPKHSHLHEQGGFVVNGKINLIIDNKVHTLEAGDSFVISSYVEHSFEALEETEVLNVFSPPRAEGG